MSLGSAYGCLANQRFKENQMRGRNVFVGLCILNAVLFGALGAQTASAITGDNTTAFTCASNGGAKDFSKAHCDPGDTVTPGTGSFGHVTISGKTSEIDATNSAVTNSTKDSEPAVLKGIVALVKTEITCSTVKADAKNSFIENIELAGKGHVVKGTVRSEFTKCTVNAPSKCTIKEPIVSEAKIEGVEALIPPNPTLEGEAMGVEFKGEGGPGTTFADLVYEGAECALKGKKFEVTGNAIATAGPSTESRQDNRESGATLVFTPKFNMQELKIGSNLAEFTSIVTPKMAGGNPISLTTTT
jgi:hypothetical protein